LNKITILSIAQAGKDSQKQAIFQIGNKARRPNLKTSMLSNIILGLSLGTDSLDSHMQHKVNMIFETWNGKRV
jgi:hypothetical protein